MEGGGWERESGVKSNFTGYTKISPWQPVVIKYFELRNKRKRLRNALDLECLMRRISPTYSPTLALFLFYSVYVF